MGSPAGTGGHIEISQLEALTHLLAADLAGSEEPIERLGNRDPRVAPHGCYPCAGDDQWIVLSAGDDVIWQALAAAIDEALPKDPRFGDALHRKRHEAALDQIIARWTRGFDKNELATALQKLGIASAPVMTPADIYDDSHLRSRGYFHELERAVTGSTSYPGVPWKLPQSPGAVVRPAPTLGQHNDEILGSELGKSEAELAVLRTKRIIGETI
jgi:benzylsuccinate CoA-transferase BbsF subunit